MTTPKLDFDVKRLWQATITIADIKPAIWRRLLLPEDLNFAQLHEVIQAAFGWTDSHLHHFVVGGLVVGAPEFGNEDVAEGRVYLYLGSASGLAASPAWNVESDRSFALLGGSVAGAGDVNGDGFDDVFVTLESPYDELWIFYGSASGVSSAAIAGRSSAARKAGSVACSSRAMPALCEPWPVKRSATRGASGAATRCCPCGAWCACPMARGSSA